MLLQNFTPKSLNISKELKFSRKAISVANEKISKMEYRVIIKNLYLKGLRGNEIYQDMVNTLHGEYFSYC